MAWYDFKTLLHSILKSDLINSTALWREGWGRELVSHLGSDIFRSTEKLLKTKTTCLINYELLSV